MIKESVILRFLTHPDGLSAAVNESFIGKLLDSVVKKYSIVLKKVGAFLEETLSGSLTLWLVKWAGERFYILFYLFIILHSLLFFDYYRNPITVAAVLLFFVCLSVRIAFDKKTKFDFKRVDPIFLLYFASIIFSAMFSMFGPGSGSSSTTTALLYLCSISLVIIIANSFEDEIKLKRLIAIIVYSTFIMSVYGIWQFINHVPVDSTQVDQTTGGASMSMGRVYSTLGNPNVLAAWLILVIPFMASLFFMAKGFRRKLLFFLIGAISIVCLALTLSRSGWVGLIIAAVVYLFLLNWRLIPLFAALGLASLPFLPRFVTDRMMTIGADTSSIYRFSLWSGSFRMALDNWLTGIGIGLEFFKRFFKNYIYMPYEQSPVHSHMLILQIWLESGLCAVISFLWFCERLIKKGIRATWTVNSGAAHTSASEPDATHSGAANSDVAYADVAYADAAHSQTLLSKMLHFPASRSDVSYILIACVSSLTGFLALGFFEYVWFFPRCMNMFFIVTGIFICALNLNSHYDSQTAQRSDACPNV